LTINGFGAILSVVLSWSSFLSIFVTSDMPIISPLSHIA
jgi:hypothetical protein